MSWGEKKNKEKKEKKKKKTKTKPKPNQEKQQQQKAGLTPTQPLQSLGLASTLLQDRDEWNNSLSREPYPAHITIVPAELQMLCSK